MARILIVDDSITQLEQLRGMLTAAGYETALAQNGEEALKSMANQAPDLLLIDYMMPVMNGLQLISAVRSDYPRLPTILVAADGSEEIAAEALQLGASGYIPKRRVSSDLLRTVQKLLSVSSSNRFNQQLVGSWVTTETQFVLASHAELLGPLVAYYREGMTTLGAADDNTLIRICVALTEALDNALYHGNYELSSELREGDGQPWREAVRQRRSAAPYKDRQIYVTSRITRDEIRFTVRDEGHGFNPDSLPGTVDPANLERSSGRGILLMKAFLDEVQFDATGNQVTLLKRRTS